MREGVREADLLFTHLHLDHVFGFPFFAPIYAPAFKLRIHVPAYSAGDAREKLARYCNGVFHPVQIRDMPADKSFHHVRSDRRFNTAGYEIHPLSLNHPGGSIGYRVQRQGKSVVYLTDSAPFAQPGRGIEAGEPANRSEQRIIQWLSEADLVIYDTMFTYQSYLERMTWGHSYPEYAVALCEHAKVKTLALYHHAPDCTDDELDELARHWAEFEGNLKIIVAREGETVNL